MPNRGAQALAEHSPRSLIRDWSLSATSAGAIAVLVGFTSSVAIVFQAAQSLGATPAQMASWMWALGLGMGLCSLVPSLLLRKPVMVAWSTPGAVVIATAATASGYTLAQATGAFVLCALLIAAVGFSGLFERVMDRIPLPLAGALLAGVLARFAMDTVGALKAAPGLVGAMVGAYLLGRRFWPRMAIPVVLLVAIGCAVIDGRLAWAGVAAAFSASTAGSTWPLGLTQPQWVQPEFTLAASLGIALPLFVVTMASQNMPGVAAIRTAGYTMPLSKLIGMTGLAMLVLAPFGAFALNLAAITAAIGMGPQSHADPARRYVAGVVNGALYVLVGLFGAAVAGVLGAFPRELVVAIAGLALLGSIAGALAVAMGDTARREAALVAFLVTLSGVGFWGIGSAFWGVVSGAVTLFVQQWRPRRMD